MNKRLIRWRIRLAQWILPDLFESAHDMCMVAMPLRNGDDDYHVDIADMNEYVAAWQQTMGYVWDISRRPGTCNSDE